MGAPPALTVHVTPRENSAIWGDRRPSTEVGLGALQPKRFFFNEICVMSYLARNCGMWSARFNAGSRASRPAAATGQGLRYGEANCTHRGRFVCVVGGLRSVLPESRSIAP